MLKVEPTGQLSRATIESGGYYRGDSATPYIMQE